MKQHGLDVVAGNPGAGAGGNPPSNLGAGAGGNPPSNPGAGAGEDGAPPGFGDGVLVGLLIAAGHLGGDARQPQLTLRMHVRHRDLFRWLLRQIPGSRLYGPYRHGGRSYFQWMVRGPAIRDCLVPLLSKVRLDEIDPPTHERLTKMRRRYQLEDRSAP